MPAEALSRQPTWNIPKSRVVPTVLPNHQKVNRYSNNEPFLGSNQYEALRNQPGSTVIQPSLPTIDYNPMVRKKNCIQYFWAILPIVGQIGSFEKKMGNLA